MTKSGVSALADTKEDTYTTFIHHFPEIPTLGANITVTMTVQQVEERLGQVFCAICKSNRFGIDSRSVKEDGEWKGICRDCFYTFPVHTDMEFYQQTQPDIPYRLREISCPSCEQRGVDLNFRIVMSVRESVYFLTCKTCSHQFPERSSLEAFE